MLEAKNTAYPITSTNRTKKIYNSYARLGVADGCSLLNGYSFQAFDAHIPEHE